MLLINLKQPQEKNGTFKAVEMGLHYEIRIGIRTGNPRRTFYQYKIFCSCTTDFGGEQNTHCCPICIDLPGTLPKLKSKVVDYAIMAGLATNCEISHISKMDRRNYCYPDLPKRTKSLNLICHFVKMGISNYQWQENRHYPYSY